MTYVESEFLELKREMTSDLAKEIVAFANTKGGKIIIGVEDSGDVVGVDDAKKICEGLSSYIKDTINPDISSMISIYVEDFFENEIVVIDVLRGISRPYYLAKKGLHPNGVFVRLGNTSVPTSEFAIRQMLLETEGVNFEDVISFNQDLHFAYATKFLAEYGLKLNRVSKRTLGLLTSEETYTNLALMISDECPDTLKIAIFSNDSTMEILDRKEFSGSVFKQLEDGYNYLEMSIKTRGTYDGLRRIDTKDYDQLVLREALLNALIHKDYSVSASILIKIYSNKIEFVSMGGLVAGVSVDDILVGISKSRNKKLANIFYRIEFIESYGTGMKKIFENYKGFMDQPNIHITPGAFKLTLPNKNVKLKSIQYKIEPEKNDDLKFKEVDYEDERAEKVLQLLSDEGRLSRKEIQEKLGFKQTSCIMLLNKLEEQGHIKRMNKGKNTKYYVRKVDYA